MRISIQKITCDFFGNSYVNKYCPVFAKNTKEDNGVGYRIDRYKENQVPPYYEKTETQQYEDRDLNYRIEAYRESQTDPENQEEIYEKKYKSLSQSGNCYC